MDDNGSGVGIEKSEARAAGTCATCGRQLTQCGPNGECLRCLVSLGFLADGEQAERPAGRGRLTPGPLRYAHFEVEVGSDGFPVELGAGAMAITYRARDTVLNSTVALKVIDARIAAHPEAREVSCEKPAQRLGFGTRTSPQSFTTGRARVMVNAFTRWNWSRVKRWKSTCDVADDCRQLWL